MPILGHFARKGAGFLALFTLALLGIGLLGTATAGAGGARPVDRRQPAKAAAVAHVGLQVRSVERRRRRLERLARRACAVHARARHAHAVHGRAVHWQALCARRRRALARFLAQHHSHRNRTLSKSAPARAAGGGSRGKTRPPANPTPVAESPAPTSPFQAGIVSGPNMTVDLQGSLQLGAKLVRIEFPIQTVPAEMESVVGGYAAKGIRVLLQVGFRGTLPSPAQALSLAAWAKVYGPGGTFWAGHPGGQAAVQTIEFGNETSYGYQYGDSAGSASYRERAENYARRFKEAAEAISATGTHVGLLAQADDWTGNWVNAMYAAVPGLSKYVSGWTIHPYHHWRSRLEALLKQTAAHGDTTIPVDITEWGLPSDNGRCLGENEEYNPCMPYSEAASILRSTFSGIRGLLSSRLGMFMLYQIRDQRLRGASTDSEMYYGALQHELQPKGEYTAAVKALLAGS